MNYPDNFSQSGGDRYLQGPTQEQEEAELLVDLVKQKAKILAELRDWAYDKGLDDAAGDLDNLQADIQVEAERKCDEAYGIY